ncbi:MAG: hypothetical protein EZS28_002703, partial [Streblomastix strix]
QELLTGRHPYESGTEQATIDRIKVGKPDQLPDFVPREMKELIIAMLSHDANKRPTTKWIMEQDTIKLYLRMQEDKEKQQNEIAQLRQKLAKQQLQSDSFKPKQQSISTKPKVTSEPKIIIQAPVTQATVTQVRKVLTPVESGQVGIADESVRYGRDEVPWARGWDKIVGYIFTGDIAHIGGDWIEGNSGFPGGCHIRTELNMESNPRIGKKFHNIKIKHPKF